MAQGEREPAVEPIYTLAVAAERFWPAGGMTKRGLRTEHKHGRLQLLRIAGKDFVTESAIRAMLERCKLEAPCRDHANRRAAAPAPPVGSLSTDRASIAMEQVRQILRERKQRSAPTSTSPK